MATELETLKMKKRMKKATPEDLTRLKVLQDGEQLSAADLKEVKKREEERKATDKAIFEAKKKVKNVPLQVFEDQQGNTATLDVSADSPLVEAKIKEALLPFTKIEAHDSRPDEFVLFTRGISITAGDVRKARKAMKL